MEEVDFRQPFKLATWRGILKYALPYKKSFGLLVGMMMMVAGIDALSPFVTGWVLDDVIIASRPDLLPRALVVYLVMVSLQAVVIRLFIGMAGKIEMGMNYAIRQAAFDRLQELSFSYFDKTGSGWIMARLTSDIGKLADIIAWGAVDMVWGGTMMLAMAGLMFARDWKLALVTLSVVVPLLVVSVLVERALMERSRLVRKTNSKITQAFSEGIRGARVVKTLAAEGVQNRAFGELSLTMRRASVKQARLSAFYLPVVIALGYVGTGLALWQGGGSVLAGTLSYGTLVAFVFSALQFFDPVTDLARIFADVQYAQASAERVVGLIEAQPDIVDSPEALAREKARLADGSAVPRLSGRVEFRNVSFAYVPGLEVLKDFSLDVAAGTTVALVGETGSGKTTIVNLACRFYEPTAGSIRLDGQDYKELPLAWLHGNLGYVLQQPYLFSGTVRENIRYGKLTASDAQAEQASRLVKAHDFIVDLEHGYDSPVGEGGSLLSTGQKQLVSLARAVLADPAILVLDEATSSVDTETERLVQDAIDLVLEGRTSFVVAHRLSTIVDADLILVMKDGQVREQGTHRELLAMGGYYKKLFEAQFLEETEAAVLA
ncbi:MAG: ABC transporter ATP-binding protein [Spirochaetes bacterium GWD1_61_31]|nr:MAG: ABC transporter ATP-binding protein [Spirochaetes bacterium GWB1_60_80]OHD29312.1 MAG: ABC transporter ATP-binding protein [Spirochaetes bacterium GWC1_61_12]OHD35820.1 MAG: ABC transporter ATP-binding protein [Spirochaetes bacterium GWD1_61_31]OHD46761.1 MAG: ABC transporter ATP-binding protein [Spirochaetes bacterium GWE1_60_18]OHD61213.1 MAG: ABC transporter ATP-binding protein [Spirochaetes bacterium GWF1_60_12]HAP43029.1 ABC transporter ATP-binding protein [Spirochaetaceae bacteri